MRDKGVIDYIYRNNRPMVEAMERHQGIRDLVSGIYPDKAHFIYELLQNAEDAEASEASFRLNNKKLIFLHNGRPFNDEDIEGICTIGSSPKKDDQSTIGKFGVGFKSVFLYSKTPKIWSRDFSFKISDLILPEKISPLKDNLDTLFEFEFNSEEKSAESAYREVDESLRELSGHTILFLKNIKKINIHLEESSEPYITEIFCEAEDDNIKQLTSTLADGEKITSKYLVFSSPTKNIPEQELSVAFSVNSDAHRTDQLRIKSSLKTLLFEKPKVGIVSVYFPLAKETSNFNFFINGPFITDMARSSLKINNPFNNQLFMELRTLIQLSFQKMKEKNLITRELLELLPNSMDNTQHVYEEIRLSILEMFKDNEFLLTDCKQYVKSHSCRTASLEIRDLISSEDLTHIEKSRLFWAMPAAINSRLSIFYKDLDIDEFNENTLFSFIDTESNNMLNIDGTQIDSWPPKSRTDVLGEGQFISMLHQKPTEWLQHFYSFILKKQSLIKRSFPSYREWLVIKMANGTICRGESSSQHDIYFPSDQSKAHQIDPSLLITTNNSELDIIRNSLLFLGVKDWDDSEKILVILNKRYKPPYEQKITDMKEFISFFKANPEKVKVFKDFPIFHVGNGNFVEADRIFLDEPFIKTSLEQMFNSFDRQEFFPLNYDQNFFQRLRIEKKDLSQFAEELGAVTSLQINKSDYIRDEHPKKNDLIVDSLKGARMTEHTKGQDFFISFSDQIFKKISKETSLMIWECLIENFEEEHLKCWYQANKTARIREQNSTLYFSLVQNNWLFTKSGELVKPALASAENLAPEYKLNPDWTWLKAIEFDTNSDERSFRSAARQKILDELGINESLIKRTREITTIFSSDELDQMISDRRKKINHSSIEVSKIKNPELRSARVIDEAKLAPSRVSEIVERTIADSNEQKTRNLAREYLKQEYERDGSHYCQICNCPVPFKLNDGKPYFEAQRFIKSKQKHIRFNYLSLCANHAAMFHHTLSDNDEDIKERIKNVKKNENFIVIKMAQKDRRIYFTSKHMLDVKAILDDN